jgi:hypothetical protein
MCRQGIRVGFVCKMGKRRKRKGEPEPEPETKPETKVICAPGRHCFADFVVKSKL